MPLALVLPDQYGYVLATATATFFVNSFHGIRTSGFRKAANIKYPAAYASNEQAEKDPAAHKFNCAQRAHANFTENQTSFLGALLISGLRYPIPAALIGSVWSVCRVVYLLGYTSDAGPGGRVPAGILATLGDLTLKLTAVYTSYKLMNGE